MSHPTHITRLRPAIRWALRLVALAYAAAFVAGIAVTYSR